MGSSLDINPGLPTWKIKKSGHEESSTGFKYTREWQRIRHIREEKQSHIPEGEDLTGHGE